MLKNDEALKEELLRTLRSLILTVVAALAVCLALYLLCRNHMSSLEQLQQQCERGTPPHRATPEPAAAGAMRSVVRHRTRLQLSPSSPFTSHLMRLCCVTQAWCCCVCAQAEPKPLDIQRSPPKLAHRDENLKQNLLDSGSFDPIFAALARQLSGAQGDWQDCYGEDFDDSVYEGDSRSLKQL